LAAGTLVNEASLKSGDAEEGRATGDSHIYPDSTRARYDRIARYYDLVESVSERLAFSRWRRLVFERVEGERVLEVGVGTGKNLDFYPQGKRSTAIDFSPSMLERARRKAGGMAVAVELLEMDVQNLSFEKHAFDTVVATFVFCSVPDPVKGLEEIRRVCRKNGRIILLEHVRPSGRFPGRLFDRLNWITVRLTGANINRNTVGNVENAGLRILAVENLFRDIVKLIVAAP
jgi:phosphatidylethanolamine/phosphatidyl-N-methylethanolamine N-methyltransferase